jgi:chondroitin AC lyase
MHRIAGAIRPKGTHIISTSKWTSLLAAIVLIPALQVFATEADDVRIIFERHVAAAMEGAEDADAQIPDILKLLDERGRFTDLKYQYKEFNKGGTLNPHLFRTQALARAWARKDGKYSGNNDIRDKAFLALRGWLEEDPKDGNWWQRTIGWPSRAWRPLIILREELKREDPKLLASWIDYLMQSWKRKGMSGANGTDVQVITLAAGALAGDYHVMKAAVDKSRDEFRFVTGSEEGVYSDGSFAQHNGGGRQLYFNGYGHMYITGFLRIGPLVKDTSLALTEENTAAIQDYFLKGVRHVTYGPEYLDILVGGRGFGVRDSVPTGSSYAGRVKQFIALDPPRKDELQELYDRLSGAEGARQPTANKMFWHADFMTHMRPDYYVSVRGTSTRTVGNESGNDQGLKNCHMGDGVNMVWHHGDEYREILPFWDWQRLPGTTVEQRKGKLPLVNWGRGAAGGTDFAGGVSDGRYGAYAFIFDEGGVNANVDAYKATFFFDNEYVALGAGIIAPNAEYPVVTTVNQTLHKGPFWVGNKNGISSHEEEAVSLAPGDWVNHYDTGYIMLDIGGNASARVAEQTGNWKMLYSSKSAEPVTGSVFSLSIDHGKSIEKPVTYAYVVAPGKKAESMPEYTAELPVEILANTSAVQAVRHKDLGITSIIFYKPGSVMIAKSETITSDRVACVMLRQKDDEIHLSVATPLYKKETVTLTIPGLYRGEGVIQKKDERCSEVVVELHGGDDAGRTVTTIIERLE